MVGGCFGGGGFFLGGSFAAAAAAAEAAGLAGLGGGPDPAFALTLALSYASLTFALRTSARPSIKALRGRSPTIFIKVPRQIAASLRAPSKESSRREANASDKGLIWGAGMGVDDVDRQRAMNLSVPSFT